MRLYAGDLDVLVGVGSVLQGADFIALERLPQQHAIPYRVEGQALKALRRPAKDNQR